MTAASLTPKASTEAWLATGIARHNSSISLNFAKAVLGGVLLSFGGLLSLTMGGGDVFLTTSYPGLNKLLSAGVFPIGIILIILTGGTLVTGEMCVFAIAAMKRVVPWWSLPLNTAVSFFGNLVGSLWVAGIFGYYSGIFAGDFKTFAINFATTKVVPPTVGMIIVRGYGCNFLVCIAIFNSIQARDLLGKIVGTFLPIFAFVFLAFDHVVANMLFIPLGLMLGAPSFDTGMYITKSMLPSLLGNAIGALSLALPLTYFYLMDPVTKVDIEAVAHVEPSSSASSSRFFSSMKEKSKVNPRVEAVSESEASL